MKILHLSYDVPDKVNTKKTVAIKNLIDANQERHENICISLNRVTSFKDEKLYYENNKISISNFGLPKGILFRYTLRHSRKIVMNLDIDFKDIDLIHAHKLTFEGPIAYYIYKKYNIPYIITLRHTDQVILKYRKDLMNYYKNILLNAKEIIIISPWMTTVFKEILGERFFKKISNKIINIPNIMNVENKKNNNLDNGKFLSVFHIKKEEIKRKNIYSVLDAIKELKNRKVEVYLDIIGDGVSREHLEKKIKDMGLQDNVKCLGKRNNNEMIEIMSNYKGFILCSYPETFGMVFIEAICAGLPIISVKNTGIDGFFHENIGEFVNHTSLESIISGIEKVDINNEYYKNNIKKIQQTGVLDNLFSKNNILDKYHSIIEKNFESYKY